MAQDAVTGYRVVVVNGKGQEFVVSFSTADALASWFAGLIKAGAMTTTYPGQRMENRITIDVVTL